ncbi:MAG: flagellar biosynthesis regulator FlaF [Aestuariivirga sp.]
MYQQFYDEVAQDASVNLKAIERRGFERSIALLEGAQASGPGTKMAVEALHFTSRLWSYLLEDLASEENGLPPELRAKLISIGIWILERAEAIRKGIQNDFQALIDINRSILSGLEDRTC